MKLDQTQQPIQAMLQGASDAARIRFCMPGHMGKLNPNDITELSGMDNLLQPGGALQQAHLLASDAFGAKSARYSVNGSTACIIAMMRTALKSGDKVIVSRDCHVSTANALTLSGAQPVYCAPLQGDIPLGADIVAIEQAMIKHGDAKAVFITYPNYYGTCCDITRIKKLCQQHGMALLIDGAHGAHLGFCQTLPQPPTLADAWCVSLHKTLHAPNQSALLCLGHDSLLDEYRLFHQLSMLQTTSPSWPMLADMDAARARAATMGKQAYDQLILRIQDFQKRLAGDTGILVEYPLPKGVTRDATRIVLDVTPLGHSGHAVLSYLAAQGIAAEMSDSRHVLFIATPNHGQREFSELYQALVGMPGGKQAAPVPMPQIPLPRRCIQPSKADAGKTTQVKLENAQGLVATQAIGTYPPGIAAVMPGDVITAEQIEYLQRAKAAGDSITGIYSIAGQDMIYCMG